MIRAKDKRLVRSIYVMRCGYCGLSEAEIGAELTFDHFQPKSAGGSDEAENIVYGCHACNEFKGEYWGDTDETRLLHPLRDDLKLHIRERADGTLEGITSAGNRYINKLQLNRPPLVLHRKSQIRETSRDERILSIEKRIDQILARIQAIEEQSHSRRT